MQETANNIDFHVKKASWAAKIIATVWFTQIVATKKKNSKESTQKHKIVCWNDIY